MTPLMMEIIRHLCATFVVGLAVGWLAKQRYSARTTTQYRTLWEERLQRRKQELDTAQLTVQNYATEIQGLESQLKATTSTLAEQDATLATITKDLATKRTELETSTVQMKVAQEQADLNRAALSEERQKMRELDTNYKLQRARVDSTLRTKEAEIKRLHDRLAVFEAQHARLIESNNKQRQSCARYQTDLHKKEAEAEQMQARIGSLEMRAASIASPATHPQPQTVRMHMAVGDKDAEIARLRARIAGLQLLLRRGPRRLQESSTGVPVGLEPTTPPQG